MHRELIGEGLVFKVGRFRESDCWVRFFSPALGLVTAFAFGGAKSRRRFCGCLDALNRVLFKVRFFPVKGYYCLDEGTLLQTFPGLRRNLGRQGLIANCIRFVQALHVDAQAAPAVHALLLETLEALEQAEEVSPLFAQFFRVKICFEQGFAPCLGACVVCGRDGSGREALLSLDLGRVYCLQCAPFASRAVHLGSEAHAALRRIAASGPRQWNKTALSRPACAEVYRIAEGYTRYHLGLRWSHGRFVPA